MSFDLHTGDMVPLDSLAPAPAPSQNGTTPPVAKTAVAAAPRPASATVSPPVAPARVAAAAPTAAADPVPAHKTAPSTNLAPQLRPNRVQWRGWIDSNPEVRRSNSGMDFCAIRVAQQVLNTQRQLMSQAVEVVLFHAAARDFVATYRKGDFIEVNGELRIRQWRDKQGREHLDVNLHPSEEIALITPPQHTAPRKTIA